MAPELKRKIADLYLANRHRLDKSDHTALESFASEILGMIAEEKEKSGASHDLEVLEQGMRHLKEDSIKLEDAKPGTEDYDFAIDDCRNLINSTRKWLTTERRL